MSDTNDGGVMHAPTPKGIAMITKHYEALIELAEQVVLAVEEGKEAVPDDIYSAAKRLSRKNLGAFPIEDDFGVKWDFDGHRVYAPSAEAFPQNGYACKSADEALNILFDNGHLAVLIGQRKQ